MQRAINQEMPVKHGRLMSYPFPGNIRELRNLLERACILANDSEIDWIDLPEPAAGSASSEASTDSVWAENPERRATTSNST